MTSRTASGGCRPGPGRGAWGSSRGRERAAQRSRRPDPQLALRCQDEGQEQDDERQRRWDTRQGATPGDVLRQHSGADPDRHAAGVSEEEAVEHADRRRAEGVEHQQGERRRVQAGDGGEQDSGDGGEAGSDDPGPPPDPDRVDPFGGQQVRVLDGRLHSDAQASGLEEPVQGHRPGQGQESHDDLVLADHEPRKVDGLVGEEELQDERLAAEDLLQERLRADQQADRRRHPGGERCAIEAGGQPFEEQGHRARPPGPG